MHYRPSQWQTLTNNTHKNAELKIRELPKEILKENFCKILKQRADIDVNPADILAIHRVPGNRDGGPCPVIMRMISSEAKLRIIKHQKLM